MKTCPSCGKEFKDDVERCAEDGAKLITKKIDPLLGTTVDNKYHILEKLGHGGMGAVYKAEHIYLHNTVALKVLHRHLAEDEQYLKRFQQEAQTSFKIKHPNAITLIDFGVADGFPYLAMDFVEGRTLKDILKEEGALSLQRTYDIIHQVSGALIQAHELNIIHRDLKPDNIMIIEKDDGSEWAEVLDFGIAKVLSQDNMDSPALTQAGVVFGTPKYMAPEQAQERDYDTRVDVYAFGIIVYEMLSGLVPYDAKSLLQIVFKQVNQPATPLHELENSSGVPAAVSNVVMKAIETDPDNRYQNLESFIADFEKAAGSRISLRSKTEPKQSLKRRAFMWSALAASVIALLFVIRGSSDPGQEALRQQATEEMEKLKLLQVEQAQRAKELEKLAEEQKAEALQATLEAQEQQKTREAEEERLRQLKEEALQAKLDFETQQKAREEEEARIRKLQEEAKRATVEAESIRRQADELKAQKAEAAAATARAKRAEEEARKAKSQAELARKRGAQKLEAARRAAQEAQAASDAAAASSAAKSKEEQPSEPTTRKKRRVTQGKRR